MGVVTLGTKEDEQLIDSLHGVSYKKFMLHYNFPSFCVGEARPPRGPDVVKLAMDTLPSVASATYFQPEKSSLYTIRLVSEVLESNGFPQWQQFASLQ